MDLEITPQIYADLLENHQQKCIRVVELEEELNQIASARQVADDEAQKVPQSRGWRRIFHFFTRFWL